MAPWWFRNRGRFLLRQPALTLLVNDIHRLLVAIVVVHNSNFNNSTKRLSKPRRFEPSSNKWQHGCEKRSNSNKA